MLLGFGFSMKLASDFKFLLSKVGPILDLHEQGLETELEAENRGNRYNFSWRIRIRGARWHMASPFQVIFAILVSTIQ